jgi:signal transduction histidine kinase
MQTIKFRMMFIITIMLVLVVGVPVGFFVYQLDKNYEEFSINLIETASQVVYQFIYDGMMSNDSLEIQHNLELLSLDPSIELVRIYRPSGKVLYSSEREEIRKDMTDLTKDVALPSRESREIESFIKMDNLYSHHHPIYISSECTPCHTNVGSLIAILDVHAGFTTSDQIYTTSKNLAIFGGLIIIVILWILLNLLYQSQVESRLKVIMTGFEKLSGGNFNFKLHMPGKHELAILSNKFNQMVDNLKNSRQREDSFMQEKLQRADRLVTLGEVAAVIAHEVNNPAGIILSRAEFLKELVQEKDGQSEWIQDLDMIIQQTEKIADTTRSILHYSRKLPHPFSETDLNKVIRHSKKILDPRLRKGSITTKFDFPAEPVLIWGNADQLEQVFCNLINNSLDFLKPNEGIIQIQIEKIKQGRKLKGYRIIHQDNGPGIPVEYHDKIFSPFFTTKEKDKGTGLGLFIVKNIISNHKGTIILEGDGSRGARFIMELEAFHDKN